MTPVTVRIHPPVEAALKRGGPVVALESTVITHGLPRPENLRLAQELEELVRAGGGVPATIGVLKGELVIGLSAGELAELANRPAHKASLWNLAALAAAGHNAGTTVATTLHAAAMVGIKVFATGGIGGVHPGRSEVIDESADLHALASHRLVVVCAGAKSILNIPATLERLETLGVPVIGYQTDFLAGFYVPETRYPVAARLDSPEAIAQALTAQEALQLPAALLVAKPVSEGLTAQQLEVWLAQAQRSPASIRRIGMHGKDLTPYLLARLAELSAGRTVAINLRLLKENVMLATEIAGALAKPRRALC
ncbi:MAG: pseudouridine-5'-phosphate glycosidase [Truepera sp.]|nr:pseudouridine-5'-phosphate glycosidase [Truepera sp.]